MNWGTDEPSERGIESIERMRLVRNENSTRVDQLVQNLLATPRTGPAAG